MRQLFILLLFITIYSASAHAEKIIYINKQDLQLLVIDRQNVVFRTSVCLGQNYGQKLKSGDHKTPEGWFTISMIQESASWSHDFNDGKGPRKGAYGPWFFRLKTPISTHIGIHGTCFPNSIGKRESEGCVRLKNEDIVKLKQYVFIGMKVYISSDTIK